MRNPENESARFLISLYLAIQNIFIVYLGIIEGMCRRRKRILPILVLVVVYITRVALNEATALVPVLVRQIMTE